MAQSVAGDDAGATTSLTKALALAEPQGYVRSFLDADPALTDVLASARRREWTRTPPRSCASGRPTPLRRRSRSTDPDELSDRELDVLRLLRSDLSGPEIARELHVSLNTLRTHTKHIYTKLGATNRREAVTRAAELGL